MRTTDTSHACLSQYDPHVPGACAHRGHKYILHTACACPPTRAQAFSFPLPLPASFTCLLPVPQHVAALP